MDLLLPNLVRSDQKIDPIEGFLPYYISSIGQNLYTCLIPDIRGDDPIMDKFRSLLLMLLIMMDRMTTLLLQQRLFTVDTEDSLMV